MNLLGLLGVSGSALTAERISRLSLLNPINLDWQAKSQPYRVSAISDRASLL
jgi:hypothetical protein